VGVFLQASKVGDSDDLHREVVLLQGQADDGGICILHPDLKDGESVEAFPVVRARGHREWRAPQILAGRRKDEPPAPPAPRLEAGGNFRFEVAMERGTTLRGRVTDTEGHPVASAVLGLVLSHPVGCSWPYAFGMSHDVDWPPPCRTDADGRFEWLSFPKEYAPPGSGGTFVLMAESPDHAHGMIHGVELLPSDCEDVIDVAFLLDTGAGLEGTVLGPDELPAAGALVTLRGKPEEGQPVCVEFPKNAVADAGGRFSARGLRRTRHRLEIAMAGCAPFSMEVDLAEGSMEPLRILLKRGSDLTGRVFRRNGLPSAGARIFVYDGSRSVRRETRSDDAGRFRIVGLPEKGYLTVHCVPNIVREIHLPCAPLELREPGTCDLEVRLVSRETGDSLKSGGWVTVLGPGFSFALESDDVGRYRRTGLPVGHYEAIAEHPERAVVRSEFDLPEGGLADPVVFRLPRGGRVRGRVTDPSGSPLPGARVRVRRPPSYNERAQETDADGRFEVPGLGAGSLLVFEAEGFALHVRRFLRFGPRAGMRVVNVKMGAGARVRGRVLGPDGAPVVRTPVATSHWPPRPTPYRLPSSLTDDQGRFTIEHVPKGWFVVTSGTARRRFRSGDGMTKEIELQVD